MLSGKLVSWWFSPEGLTAATWVYAGATAVLALATLLLACAAMKAGRQWNYELKERRKAARAKFTDDFIKTPGARNATLMLFSSDREIPLWDAADPADRYHPVNWKDVEDAFTPERIEAGHRFYSNTPKHTAIRDSFDDFFGRLNYLNSLLDDNLISDDDAHSIASPWLNALDFSKNAHPHIARINEYIVAHHITQIAALMKWMRRVSEPTAHKR